MTSIITQIFVLTALTCGCIATTTAQTLHAIIACNTADRSIGESMKRDLENMSNAIQIIMANFDYEFEMQQFDGVTCTKANITKYINDMEVGRDDIVFFFYGGHGTHAFNNADDPWPQMCMNTNIESLFMPVTSVDKLIAAKQPKLRIILTNCCNKEQTGVSIKPLYAQSEGPTTLSDYNPQAFRKLFLDSKGKVMMTSSKLGQYSWCGAYGGLFTNYLLDVLDAVGMNKITPTGNAVCKTTQEKTLACNTLPGGAKQEPYFEVKIAGEKSKDVVPPTPSTDNLYKALQVLVNHNYSKDERLDKIDIVLNKFFTSDAHVVTVGRNGTSRIMYEDVMDFLRRLALSDNIKQINVLEGNGNEKNSFITVHEVRY